MAEPYQDPETDPPKPIRRRTGSFPVRSGTNDTQHRPSAGTRHVPPLRRRTSRPYFEEPQEYSSVVCLPSRNGGRGTCSLTSSQPPPPAPPGFIPQSSFGSYTQSPQQGPGLQYAPYGYPADQPVRFVQVDPPSRRQARVNYGSNPFWPPGPPMPYDIHASRHYRTRSRSRSRSRSPRRPSGTDSSADYLSRTARVRSRGSDDTASEVGSDEESSGSSYVDGVLKENDLTTAKVYEFRPSRLSRSPSQDASITASGSEGDGPLLETEKASPVQNEGPSTSTSRTARMLKIYRSEYTGDAFADGSHSARLTVIHDPKRTRQPIFRWMYV